MLALCKVQLGHTVNRSVACHAAAPMLTPSLDTETLGACSIKGSARKINEDRYDYQIPGLKADGSVGAFIGVFDGHGGVATSEWLEDNMYYEVQEYWQGGNAPKKVMDKAFRVADSKLLAPGGFMGMGERGVGGSKCGSTAAIACIYQTGEGTKLLASNVGDARVILARGGKPLQLTTDHVPDDENERLRIEAQNPNPKLPLVRYVGNTWRVGGLLALSRALGDAYMKGSLQFEGISSGDDDYSAGFGVIAEPSQQLVDLTPEDTWLIACSDGLFANEGRGGGGGLTNEQIVQVCDGSGSSDPTTLAEELCRAAQAAGSTDDVTVVLAKLQ